MTKNTLPAYPKDPEVQKRFEILGGTAHKNGWRFVQDTTMRMLDGSSLYRLARRERQYQNHLIGDDWEYAEISFQARGQAGLNRLRKKEVHYALMSTKLPRKLPNVVFDSLKQKRRQFRVVFDRRQYIQLEGNFHTYFDTYFGSDYTIDDMSFITPDVMEALIAAGDYSVEIVHDHLLLFGQVQPDAEAQVLAMQKDIELIRKKLRINILAYRDERVPYDQGRLVVARAGMYLEQRPIGALFVLFVIGGIYLLPVAFILVVALIVFGH